MKKVNAWVTSDEVVHLDHDLAVKHAESRYGDLLTDLAHKSVRIGKYMEMCTWIDANLHRFQELARLLDDVAEEDARED